MSFASDLAYGTSNEVPTKSILESFFNTTLKQRGGYSVFDYDNVDEGQTMFIELKSRRIPHNLYPTSIIGANKVWTASQNPDRTYWFCYKYTDGIWGIKYDRKLFETFDRSDFSRGERSDFHNHPQECYFIPREHLIPIA
jgi:hypothetical protein